MLGKNSLKKAGIFLLGRKRKIFLTRLVVRQLDKFAGFIYDKVVQGARKRKPRKVINGVFVADQFRDETGNQASQEASVLSFFRETCLTARQQGRFTGWYLP